MFRFFGFFVFTAIDESVGESHEILNDVSWNDNGSEALPNEAVQPGSENGWGEGASFSSELIESLAESVSHAVRISQCVTWSDTLWELELK